MFFALRQAAQDDIDVHLPGVVYLVAALAAAAVVTYLVRAMDTGGTRDRAVRRLANAHGWRYATSDPAGIGDLRFHTFAGAENALVTNVVTADGGGGRVRAFDYSLLFERRATDDVSPLGSALADDLFGLERTIAPRMQRTYTKRRSGAVARVDAFLPSLVAAPSNFVTRAFEGIGLADVDFESVAFNRKWDVRCGDERFAWLFCDASMIDLILELGSGVTVETFGNYILVTRALLADADDVMRFAEQVANIPEVLNPLIRAEYPTVAVMESDAMVDAWKRRPDGAHGAF